MERCGLSDSNITKKALATALKTLMQTQPFEKISVGEICEACELNRKSFYYHFKDKYDLVEWIFHSEFITTVADARVTDRWSFVRALCDYFYRERTFYSKLLRLTGQNSFRQYFSEYLFQTVEPFLRPNISLEAQQSENYRFFHLVHQRCGICRHLPLAGRRLQDPAGGIRPPAAIHRRDH